MDTRPCCVVVTLLVAIVTGGQLETNEITAFLDAARGGGGWGLADATATVGKLFRYELPRGDVQVSELVSGSLPAWLEVSGGGLVGVAGPEHAGASHLLTVGSGDHSDSFTVTVAEDEVHSAAPVPVTTAASELRPVRCPAGASVTTATIIVNTDLGQLRPSQKASLLEGLCRHLGLPADVLKLAPVGNRPMFDSAALVAGPGDVRSPSAPGAVVTWAVGCGNVQAPHMPVLQAVEATAHDGAMATAAGHGIVGWHVTNTKLSAPRRLKRQIRATATLQPGFGPPTRQPVPTRLVPSEPDQPSSRVVPIMSSPVFPGGEDMKPTHKHKHRTKTKGRHHHQETVKHSPKHAHTHTAVPSVLPILPTQTVEVAATRGPEDPQVPVEPVPSPGVSRSVDLVQPSMTPPLPGAGVPSETPALLPSDRPTVPVATVTAAPVRPTQTDGAGGEPTRGADAETPQPGGPEVLEPTDDPDTDPDSESESRYTPAVPPFNYDPILKNDIVRLTVMVGDLFDYKIPKKTFHDYEDGNTRKLKLVFLTVEGMNVPRTSWVKFNEDQQRLYGLPLPEHEGRVEYLIAAIDSGGKITRDPFEIVVTRRPADKQINHEMSMTLDLDYDHFVYDVDQRLDVANKIASVYGDRDARHMTVTRIDRGSVEYAWTNNSLPAEPCPTRDIAALVAKLLTENNTIQPEAKRRLAPYTILKAGAARKGSCATDSDNVVTSPDGAGGGAVAGGDDGGQTKEVASEPRETSADDVLVTTVVPAVVIAAMLLLAALVACLLYRKKRKGKLSDEDQHTFINKGIPIIFADELEDKPGSDPSTKPLIMADEKPPLPPPQYPRSGSGSAPSTPGSGHKEPLMEAEYSPPYQPPPPLTGANGGSRGRGGQPANRGTPQQRHLPNVQP